MGESTGGRLTFVTVTVNTSLSNAGGDAESLTEIVMPG